MWYICYNRWTSIDALLLTKVHTWHYRSLLICILWFGQVHSDTYPLLYYHIEYLHFPKSTPHIDSISTSNSSTECKKKKKNYRTFSQTLLQVLQSRKCNLNFNLANSGCYRTKWFWLFTQLREGREKWKCKIGTKALGLPIGGPLLNATSHK